MSGAATKGAAASAAARRKASGNGNGNGKKDTVKAKRAVAEVVTPDAVEQKVATFRGHKLPLNELPKTFLWDLAAAGNNVVAYYALVQDLLKPEAHDEVRAARAEYDGLDGEFVDELTDAVFAEYGLGLGESSGSQDS